MTSVEETEVLVVGAGPTGLTLANILGRAGVRVLVVDRDESTVDEPRAVSIDDEALRVMQGVDLLDDVLADMLPDYGTRYRSPWGSEFAFVRPVTREYGFPRRSAFRQPLLEAALRVGATRFPSVDVRFRCTLVALEDAGERGVTATVESAAGRSQVAARFVVGADGASSTVRRLLGIELDGTSFEQRWLVVDAENDDDDGFDTVAYCDHRRPAISLPGPAGTRRWEVLLAAGESAEDVVETAWTERVFGEIGLAPPRNVVRTAVYAFHARLATRWRKGNVFLVGDAAHLTPPYAGQGMNSGIRDAANLGWKLVAAVQGLLDESALDSYEAEREPHARAMIDLALRVGRVMTPSSAHEAYGRAALFHLATVVPPIKDYFLQMKFKPKPRFERGLLLSDGVPDSMVGRMLPQPRVGRSSGPAVLLDDLLGTGFALVHLGGAVSGDVARHWKELDVQAVRIVPGDRRPLDSDEWVAVRDEGGVTERLRSYAGRTLVIRPDRYVAASFLDHDAEATAARFQRLLRGTWAEAS